MGGIAVIGNLARDTIDGGEPRVGGAPYHAARGLRLLGGGLAHRRPLRRCRPTRRSCRLSPHSASLSRGSRRRARPPSRFRTDGEEREMTVGDPGAPWTVADAGAVGRAAWVHLGGLTRGDFPADVLAVLARDRRLALDGQALVRPAETGPLVLDANFDPEVLRHITALKLNEEELEALGGEERVLALGVPELLLTAGLRRRGRDCTRRAGARAHETDRDRQSDRRRRCLPRGVHVGASSRARADLGSSPGRDDRRPRARNRARATARARANGVTAWVRTVDGVFEVDVEAEAVLGEVEIAVDHDRLDVNLPRLVAASAGGSTVVALVARRPPLLVSWDAGATWHESGGGLPPGFDVAVDSDGAGPRPLRGSQQALPFGGRRALLAVARARADRHPCRGLERVTEAGSRWTLRQLELAARNRHCPATDGDPVSIRPPPPSARA